MFNKISSLKKTTSGNFSPSNLKLTKLYFHNFRCMNYIKGIKNIDYIYEICSESSTSSSASSSGGVSGDGGNVFDSSNLHSETGQSSKSGLSTGSGGLGSSSSSGSKFNV
jgi:hypothetical protein